MACITIFAATTQSSVDLPMEHQTQTWGSRSSTLPVATTNGTLETDEMSASESHRAVPRLITRIQFTIKILVAQFSIFKCNEERGILRRVFAKQPT